MLRDARVGAAVKSFPTSYPDDLRDQLISGAKKCEREAGHKYKLYNEGILYPHWFCDRCWSYADDIVPWSPPSPIERKDIEVWAHHVAADLCHDCQTMRTSCKRPEQHFSARAIADRYVQALERV